ncbi:hypothetical protein HanLR1_Chr16g0615761 [Helianthus annuus]|nr:hypothetical protein HanLR1_Chr16g0615761 [Helianthus annuus]
MMHEVSCKGSNKGRDTYLVVQPDSSGEVGPPGYRLDEVSPNEPGQMDLSDVVMSHVNPTGEVNVNDPDNFRINGEDLDAVS